MKITDPGDRILDAFDDLHPETRRAVAQARELQGEFLSALGRGLDAGGPYGALVISRALRRARWDGGEELLDTLGSEPPWSIVREELAAALDASKP